MLEVIILFVALVGMLFFSYYVTKKELLSPSVICCGMFACSTFIMMLYYKEWKMNLSMLTVFYILWSLFCVFLGEIIATKTRINPKNENEVVKSVEKKIKINKIIAILCLIFIIVTAILYYKELVKMVANSSYAKTEAGQRYSFLMQARWAQILEDASANKFVQFMLLISEAIAYVYAYVIIYNYIMHKDICKNVFAYLNIIAYIITSFLTTGRSKMLNFMIYFIVIALIIYSRKNKWKNTINIKIFRRIFMIFLIALSLFYLAGMFTEKSLHYDNFMDNFANYFSASIHNFNEYVKDPSRFESTSDFFGIHTFSGLYSFLRKFGFDIPQSVVPLEYIQCGNYLSNIYTPLRRYIQDFGFLGLSIIMFMLGFFYTKLLKINKNKKNAGITTILTGYLFFPLFYISIEERFFMDVIINRTVYEIICIILIYMIVVDKKIKLGRK